MSVLKLEIITFLEKDSLSTLRGANSESRAFVPRLCAKPNCTRRPELSCDHCMKLLCRFHIGYVYSEFMEESRYCLDRQRLMLGLHGGYVYDGNQ